MVSRNTNLTRARYLSRRHAQRVAHTRANGLPDGVQHGRSAYANWGCRCQTCRADHAAKMAEYKARRQETA